MKRFIPLKDWNDDQAYKEALGRRGLGELGQPARLKNVDKKLEEKLSREYGYNAMLSDRISLNRSVPDIRHVRCRRQKYLSQLPDVSIILPFFDEHLSVILRSCFTILSRSPPELIKEIILVDDASTKVDLGDKLEEYIADHVPKTRIIRLKRRSGLIVARLVGAKQATGEVLIFFDAHIEPNYNWLPPLIEPIAKNPKTCVCPLIDVISHEDFAYSAQDEGGRGAFDWNFKYTRLPLLPEDLKDPIKPFRSPIMTGGLFAIGREFFWDFEGYDEMLDIWGGEQFEISFKIWMCGGEMLDAPCSRVAHIFRGPRDSSSPRGHDFLHVNLKRVAEVWMDEYKEYIYMRDPELYASIDPGDLTKQKAIRERLQCKSFKWFMETVAFDIPQYYPLVDPPDYASGALRSLAGANLCLDTLNHGLNEEVGLFPCSPNLVRPHETQYWFLSWHKDLRWKYMQYCLDVADKGRNSPVVLFMCHGQGGNQYWEYNMERKWLIHGNERRCLEADIVNFKVFVNRCDVKNKRMQWSFGFTNQTALLDFESNKKFGIRLHTDEQDRRVNFPVN
ncbi:unnamed protein product [Hermetia illucens]|uniref:Polypeptide N-acetylgalactosaminyltransferase n=2 Tax=Hermetia illucens TaxID=343691 RepID=A0A7R8UI24_HERIL|nr:unnamed protein product [Hermetia illucens]